MKTVADLIREAKTDEGNKSFVRMMLRGLALKGPKLLPMKVGMLFDRKAERLKVTVGPWVLVDKSFEEVESYAAQSPAD